MFVVFFLFAICTIQCILSTLAWVPMQTSFKVLEIKMQIPFLLCSLVTCFDRSGHWSATTAK